MLTDDWDSYLTQIEAWDESIESRGGSIAKDQRVREELNRRGQDVTPGDFVQVRDAFDTWSMRRALSRVLPGDTFAVIYACRPEAWGLTAFDTAVPWPAVDVRSGAEL